MAKVEKDGKKELSRNMQRSQTLNKVSLQLNEVMENTQEKDMADILGSLIELIDAISGYFIAENRFLDANMADLREVRGKYTRLEEKKDDVAHARCELAKMHLKNGFTLERLVRMGFKAEEILECQKELETTK